METVDEVLDEVITEEEDVDEAELEEEDAAQSAAAELAEEQPTGEMPEELADPDPRQGLDEPREELFAPAAEAVGKEAAVRVELVGVANLVGVPLWYERLSPPGPRRFPVAASFLPILERTVRQVRVRAPAAFGALTRISSAGMYVGKPGMHGLGRACDWDRWVFENVEIAPREREHAASLRKRQRYWSLAAICRANSAYLLHGRYDADHGDHLHQDNGARVEFQLKRSTVTLCQALLNDIFDQTPKLAIDGDLGLKTSAAIGDAIEKLRLTGDFRDEDVWRRFLLRSGRLGFRLSVGS